MTVTSTHRSAAGDRPKWGSVLPALGIYLGTAIAALLCLPDEIWARARSDALLPLVGALAAWRYGWWLLHVARASVYGRLVYPRLAREASALWDAGWRPARVHILLTVFNERHRTTEAVAHAICREVRATGRPATLWLGSAHAADEDVLAQALRAEGSDLEIELRIVRQQVPGKRVALGLLLRAMARAGLGANDLVAFMDSDFVLADGALRTCLALFAADSALQAVTTNEHVLVAGPRWMQSWLDMRFAQRRLAMQSHALSRRVLTLTGRFSVFRATHITREDFIRLVEADHLDDWLWGRYRFLSGDDKSTWFALLRRRAKMLYVPDADGCTIEVVEGSGALRMVENLRRWSGNMLRNGARAIALGPRAMPLFIWWCLVDQRLAMWTMLLGPLAAVLAAIRIGPEMLVAYAVYVALTRLVATLVLATYCRRVDLNFAWCLYANQLLNAGMKVYLIWRLPKQRWVNRGNQRQGAGRGGLVASLREGSAAVLTLAALVTAVALTAIVTKTASMPSFDFVAVMIGDGL